MPKKKSKKKPSPEPQFCIVDNCNNPAIVDGFCVIHGAINMVVDKAKESFNSGNLLTGLASSFAAVALESAGPMVKPALMGAAMKFAQGQQQRAPRAAPTPRIDPWKVLGLDKTKATEKDVKEVQRHYADFYHPDKGRPVNHEILQQVNAAADACLKDLRKK